jgi:hypothetical protein
MIAFSNCFVVENEQVGILSIPYGTYWKRSGEKNYILTEESTKKFTSFYEEVFPIVNMDDFALNRFNFADFRPMMVDRLVDYVIALEYLFVPGNINSEISYQFRTNATALLGEHLPMEKKKRLLNFFNEIYGSRSQIVHGGQPKIKKKIETGHPELLELIIAPIRKVLRHSILYFYYENCLENKNKEKRRILIEDKLLNQGKGINTKKTEKKLKLILPEIMEYIVLPSEIEPIK